MTGVNGGREMRDWLIRNGHEIGRRGAIPAVMADAYYDAHPGKRPQVPLLPGPDDDLDEYDDMGLLEPDPAEGPAGDEGPPRGRARYIAEPVEAEPATAVPGPVADGQPGHSRKGWARQQRAASAAAQPRASSVRLTGKVRGDINAKISLVLEVLARGWAARDPLCGGVAVEQRPDIADALTQIVCGSPDLMAWFTGSGGQFMLWLNLAMACGPVAQVVAAHHVYHSAEEMPADAQQPDYQTYAA